MLRVVADDGRLTLDHIDGIGARIAALWRTMPAARFTASLLDVGGPLGLAVLEAALRHSEGPAKGWTDVLEAWGALLNGANGDAELCARMASWKLPGPAKRALARVAAG